MDGGRLTPDAARRSRAGANSRGHKFPQDRAVFREARLPEGENLLHANDVPFDPVISEMLVTFRLPSLMRLTCTTTSMAEAIWRRVAISGNRKFDMATIVSKRARASRAEFEWIVVKEPSWPVFIA